MADISIMDFVWEIHMIWMNDSLLLFFRDRMNGAPVCLDFLCLVTACANAADSVFPHFFHVVFHRSEIGKYCIIVGWEALSNCEKKNLPNLNNFFLLEIPFREKSFPSAKKCTQWTLDCTWLPWDTPLVPIFAAFFIWHWTPEAWDQIGDVKGVFHIWLHLWLSKCCM